MDWPLAIRSAEIALAAYAGATIETKDVHALIVEDPDILWIGLRGTDDFIAVLRDAAAAFERNDPILGCTPNSFAEDVEEIFWRILPKLPQGKAIGIGAHSKGASEAQILAAMFAYAGRPVSWLGAFEPAPVGTLSGWLKDQPGIATWRGEDIDRPLIRDPVPAMPLGRPHAMPMTALAWWGPTPLNLANYHSMSGVLEAVKRLAIA
jgi:hypothetical protein